MSRETMAMLTSIIPSIYNTILLAVRGGHSWCAKYGIERMMVNTGSFWDAVLYIYPPAQVSKVLFILCLIIIVSDTISGLYLCTYSFIPFLCFFVRVSSFSLILSTLGYHALDIMIWKPTLQEGALSGLAESLLAGVPDVKYLRELVVKPYLRSQVQTDTIGSIIVAVNTITNGFEKYGVGF